MEAQLGGSRTGEVWRARDNQTGATVAYKVVAPASLTIQSPRPLGPCHPTLFLGDPS